jgi:hypothetical protein
MNCRCCPRKKVCPKIKGVFGTALGHMHQPGVGTNDHAAALGTGPSQVFLDQVSFLAVHGFLYAFTSRRISQAAT